MGEVFTPGPRSRTVVDAQGKVRDVPDGWALLPPGDAAATRRVKAGPHWVVEERRGRKLYSRGVWAPEARIAEVREALEAERGTAAWARKREADQARREREQHRYQGEFEAAVLAFLDFHPTHADLARALAARVTAHATPVGSGTVARTKRIEVSQRAEAAVIAWMRHQTTAYDQMRIARVKGRRREVRRELAARSREVLARYRDGRPPPPDCPLQRALTPQAALPPPSAPQRASLFARLKKQIDG